MAGFKTLLIYFYYIQTTVSQETGPVSCAYTFYVKGIDQQCKSGLSTQHQVNEDISVLKRQVSSLHEQLTSLVKQNDQLLQLALGTGAATKNITTLKTQVHPLSQQAQPGSVYVRWGRTVCPAGADIIFDGYAGGSSYTYYGGMAEYLCLPKNPQWNRYKNGFQYYASLLWGGELQLDGHEDLLSYSNNNEQTLHQHDVSCAVCYVTGKGSVMMVPARRECPEHWHREYEGYLMAPSSNEGDSKLNIKPVCMDEAPEAIPRSQANLNGALFYFVEAKCGSLPCPPYVDGREVTCVVCTR